MGSITLQKDREEVYEAIRQAAVNLDWTVSRDELENGLIVFDYGGDLLSFGNVIEVAVRVEAELSLSIVVTSRSAAQIQLIDWGKNDELEEQIIAETRKLLQI